MSCNKSCGKICQTPDETPQERALWTGIKKLNCNDYTYINGIIADLERAKRAKDIPRVLAYGRELERIKVLCGNTTDETVQRFERSIELARDTLGLQNCKVIQRSLENKPETQRVMIGYEQIEITKNPDGTKTLSYPEKPPKQTPLAPFEHTSKLLFDSRNQAKITEIEK